MKKAIVLLFSVASIWPYAGSSSLEFLNINTDAVYGSLGGSGVAMDGLMQGIFKNPASISLVHSEYNSLASYTFYSAASLWTCAFAYREKSVAFVVAGKGMIYDLIPAGIPYADSFSTNYGAMDMFFTAGVGVPIGEMLSLPFGINLGCSIGYAYEKLDDVNISAISANAGITTSFFNNMCGIGAAIQNIGFASSQYEMVHLPVEAVIGGRFTYKITPEFVLSTLVDTDLAAIAGQAMAVRVGVEGTMYGIILLRSGMVFADHQIDFSVGCGTALNIDKSKVTINYSFSTMAGIEFRQVLQVEYAFGKTR
ncbi:MAG: hypothetical protein HZC28_13285 [Spirochaetes bacterium]|nr:hypothetical protein [Spirochaetota bacterium]